MVFRLILGELKQDKYKNKYKDKNYQTWFLIPSIFPRNYRQVPALSFFYTNKPNNKNTLEIDKRHVSQKFLYVWFYLETIFGIFYFEIFFGILDEY